MDKTASELDVFLQFASAAQLPLRPDSVEKRQPPEPDILCELEGDGRVAFELVEIVDPALIQRTNDQVTLGRALKKAAEERGDRLSSFGDALVLVSYLPSASLAVRKKSVPLILDQLNLLAPDFCGKWRPESHKLAKVVDYLYIRRELQGGPHFGVTSITAYSDPTLDTIFRKLSRSYEAQHPIELLAYYDLHPSNLGSGWEPNLAVFSREWLRGSTFRRVWCFDVLSRQVRVFPPPPP